LLVFRRREQQGEACEQLGKCAIFDVSFAGIEVSDKRCKKKPMQREKKRTTGGALGQQQPNEKRWLTANKSEGVNCRKRSGSRRAPSTKHCARAARLRRRQKMRLAPTVELAMGRKNMAPLEFQKKDNTA
jgi:hypothetical protein